MKYFAMGVYFTDGEIYPTSEIVERHTKEAAEEDLLCEMESNIEEGDTLSLVTDRTAYVTYQLGNTEPNGHGHLSIFCIDDKGELTQLMFSEKLKLKLNQLKDK
jgi:hypothetical protein